MQFLNLLIIIVLVSGILYANSPGSLVTTQYTVHKLRLLFLFSWMLPLWCFSQEEAAAWKPHYDSALSCWNTNINRSITLLNKAERIAFNDLGIYDDHYLNILNELGLAYAYARDYQKAEECFRKNLAIQTELGHEDDARMLHVKCNLASVYLQAGKEDKAAATYRQVINQANLVHPIPYRAAVENLLRIYESREQFDSAKFIVRDALNVLPSSEQGQQMNGLRLAEGRILRKEKKYAQAEQLLQHLQTGLTASEALLTDAIRVELGLIHLEKGLYIEAEKELLLLYRKLKSSVSSDDELLTELINGLGYTYEKLSIYEKAQAYYQEALNRCVTAYGYNSLSCFLIQNNLAGIYLRQGKTDQAIAHYEEFIRLYDVHSKDKNGTYMTAVNNLASAYRQHGSYELAIRNFNEVYHLLETKNQLQSDLAATVLNNRAVTYALQGKYMVAVSDFEKAMRAKEKLYGVDSPVLLDLVGNLALSYWMLKRYDEALPLFQRSLVLSRRQIKYIFPNLTEEEQVQFYTRQKQNFERFNTLSIQSASIHPELLTTMFNNQLLIKSLTFFTNTKRNAAIARGNNPEVKLLLQQIESKGIQLGFFYQTPLSDLNALQVSLPELEQEIDSLEKAVRHTMHLEAPVEQEVDWKAVQHSLDKTEAVVEIIRFRKYDVLPVKSAILAKQINAGFTDSVYYAALITTVETTKTPALVLLKNGNQLETRFFSYYRNAIRFDIKDTLSYAQFWKPIAAALPGKQKIYLSADGIFHQLNLNALRDEEGEFMLEKTDLYPVLNASQLVSRKKPVPIDFSRMVMFGDPIFSEEPSLISGNVNRTSYFNALPGTGEELRGIAKALQLPASVPRYLQQEANETNFRKIHSPGLLHIATHGFFSSDMVYTNEQAKNDFLFHSGIVLSRDKAAPGATHHLFEHDGIITAYDVIHMDLSHTGLVVLSACDTGLGKIEAGEGIYGLQRSFLQAGASQVLVSLWKVEDAMTRNLMIKFYTYLVQHSDSRKALKQAQLDLLNEVGNPRQWAAFVMIGTD